MKFSELAVYAAIPVGAIILGGTVGLLRKPSGAFLSSVLHFAAGVVFSVVAVELLPDIIKQHLPLEVGIGFGLGIGTMLLLKILVERVEEMDPSTAADVRQVPLGLLIAMGIDMIVDGFLLGIGFAAGNKEGVLLSAALAFEVFSLGLAVTLACLKNNMRKGEILFIQGVLGLVFAIGAMLGLSLLSSLSPEMMELVLSFGLAALLFLVTEELLKEAHEEKETVFQTALFFSGFLIFLLIGMSV